MLELLVSVIVAVVLDEITEVVEVEAARLVVLIGLKVEVRVMVADKMEGKVQISGNDGPEISSVVHDCRIGTACGKALDTGEDICPPSTGTATIEISQKFQFQNLKLIKIMNQINGCSFCCPL